jgi:hypothetical protein
MSGMNIRGRRWIIGGVVALSVLTTGVGGTKVGAAGAAAKLPTSTLVINTAGQGTASVRNLKVWFDYCPEDQTTTKPSRFFVEADGTLDGYKIYFQVESYQGQDSKIVNWVTLERVDAHGNTTTWQNTFNGRLAPAKAVSGHPKASEHDYSSLALDVPALQAKGTKNATVAMAHLIGMMHHC